jgi:hypothetical protein
MPMDGPEHDWLALSEAEPALLELEAKVEAYAEISLVSQQPHCLRAFYFNWLSPQLTALVGSKRQSDPTVPAWLPTSAAFDTARYHLQELAGPCRHEHDCGWIARENLPAVQNSPERFGEQDR